MDSTEDNPQEAASPGRTLATARERHGLSRTEVAQRLHMSAHQIEALESDDYSRLPKGPFLRGFVRNYAKLLAIDAAPLVEGLREAAPGQPRPGIVVPSQNIRFDPLGERLSSPYVKAGVLAFVAVAFAFAGMYWWLFIKPTPPAKSAEAGPPQQIVAAPVTQAEVPPPAPAPTSEASGAESAPGKAVHSAAPAPQATTPQGNTPHATTPPPSTPAASPATTAALPATPVAAPKAPVPRGHRVVRMRFAGESWVEIKDADGNVLHSRLNAPESEAEVSGKPPLAVIVGNA
ncbi:MAG TPA: RodZ domain-containing protein, partial [Usitatibacter sp.]|nr:RodZ domain-containing protein [Usitatibacter sp.]